MGVYIILVKLRFTRKLRLLYDFTNKDITMKKLTMLKITLLAVSVFSVSACTTRDSMSKDKAMAMEKASTDIVDTAVAAGSFNTLVAAVQAGGLVDTLKGDGPFTVFAPTDESFAKLPLGTIDELLMPENKAALQSILTYHVIAGKVMSSDIAGKTMDVATVNGQTIAVNAANGVMINNASVTTADVSASNGVIHVIDTVLLPK